MPTTSSSHSRSKAPSLTAIGPERKKQLAAFQKTAGIRFKSMSLLNLSFMHRSVSNESGFILNNERLEFLGDSIVGAACATLLYQNYADKAEGDLAKIKSAAVCEDALSSIARILQLDTMLLLGKGEDLSGGRTKKAILADTLEALVGALYLDSGYKSAFAFICPYLITEIDRIVNSNYHRDYKSLLQELCQRQYHSYPQYQLVKRSGPDHERIFWMEVCVNGETYGPGIGRNKKSAEQEAAKIAYEYSFQPNS